MAYEQLVSVPGSAPKNYVPTTDGLGGYSWAPQQGGGSGGGGTTDHNQLTNRDAENQHPMSAITGLVEVLEDKQPKGDYLTGTDIDNTLSVAGKAADAAAVGEKLNELSEEIAGLSVGGISATARGLLITVLRNGVYSSDQSTNITALEEALGGSGETETTTYTITSNLTNVTSDNSAANIVEGGSYTATLTADDGYTLDDVTVTMGGVDVTSDVYADGVVSIVSVTGDVVITASAVMQTEELPFVPGKTYTVDDLEVVEGNEFNASGIISESSGFSYAIFPCRGANRAMFNSSIYANYGILMLAADKTYIRTVGTAQTSGLFTEDGITFVEISRDAEYIMFQARSANMPNVTLELDQDPEYNGVYDLNTWYRIPWRVGYSVKATTGVISENADTMCSDYMSIYGATTIQISNGLRHFHVFYGADKNYLSTVTVQSAVPASYNIPDGATYLVIAPPNDAQHYNCSIRITE